MSKPPKVINRKIFLDL